MPRISSIIDEYLTAFPEERKRLAQLLDLIRNSQSEDALVSSNNYIGHITASGSIISRRTGRILLLHHRIYHLYLQPGGHLRSRNLLEDVRSKLEEETSITTLDHLPFHFDHQVPIDIDTHQIPADRGKGEPAHFHHDFRFVFLTDAIENELVVPKDKFPDYKWVDINELLRFSTYASLAHKIDRLLSDEYRPKIFFERVIQHINLRERISAIVVTHLLPDTEIYLRALDKVSRIVAVIPKPRSIVQSVYDKVSARFRIEPLSREMIAAGTDVVPKLVASAPTPVALFDIGGYFAPVVLDLARSMPGKVLGVVEDTENGHQKYQRLGRPELPVYSVARSPLKANEDFLVGQSIVFSSDAIMRELGRLIQYLDCAVLGFGKVGSSIAHHLLLRGIKPSVFDDDPVRRLEAHNRLCATPQRDQLIRNSDVIFSATGNFALSILDFRQLRAGCVVFSVTSSDDELDLRYLDTEYLSEEVADNVTKYSSFNNYFYLVNRGNAVNFLHKAVLGNFIHVVRGEMIFAEAKLVKEKPEPGMHQLTLEERQALAGIWLRTFVDEKTSRR